jgi:hypothetical protein
VSSAFEALIIHSYMLDIMPVPPESALWLSSYMAHHLISGMTGGLLRAAAAVPLSALLHKAIQTPV